MTFAILFPGATQKIVTVSKFPGRILKVPPLWHNVRGQR